MFFIPGYWKREIGFNLFLSRGFYNFIFALSISRERRRRGMPLSEWDLYEIRYKRTIMNVHCLLRNLNYYTSRNSYLAAKEIYFISGTARCLTKLKRLSSRRASKCLHWLCNGASIPIFMILIKKAF